MKGKSIMKKAHRKTLSAGVAMMFFGSSIIGCGDARSIDTSLVSDRDVYMGVLFGVGALAESGALGFPSVRDQLSSERFAVYRDFVDGIYARSDEDFVREFSSIMRGGQLDAMSGILRDARRRIAADVEEQRALSVSTSPRALTAGDVAEASSDGPGDSSPDLLTLFAFPLGVVIVIVGWVGVSIAVYENVGVYAHVYWPQDEPYSLLGDEVLVANTARALGGE